MAEDQTKYRDPEPNNFPDDYDRERVDPRVLKRTKAVREKMYGVDTRAAMAQAEEISSVVSVEAKEIAAKTDIRQTDLENRYNDQLAGNTDISEVIDLRRPKESEVAYETAGQRIDRQIGVNSDFRGNESDQSFMQRTNKEFTERSVNLTWFGPSGDGISDDSVAIKSATAIGYQTYVPRGIYALANPVEALTDIIGDYATLKAQSEGIPYLLALSDKETVIIKNMCFDLNNLGRGGVHIKNAKRVIVQNCEFTGYTAEFGYHRTDSCLLIENCTQVFVDNCYFHDSGYQYDASLETLNRCLTTQGEERQFITIKNCRFERANQAIVCSGTQTDVTITDCAFDSTRDNSIYFIPVKVGKVIGCSFDDKYDEAIVMGGGGDIFIDTCLFKNAPNKFIAIAGDINRLSIANCAFDSTVDYPTNNIFSFRDNAYVIKHLNISTCTMDLVLNGSADVFSFGNVKYINIDNLYISVIAGELQAAQRIFSFRGAAPQAGRINDVNLSFDDNGSINITAMLVDGNVGSNIIFDNNNFPCRTNKNTINRGYRINPNVNASNGIDRRQIYSAGHYPTAGTWKKGDIVYNDDPALGSPSNGHIGWVCTTEGTPGVWRKFGILEA